MRMRQTQLLFRIIHSVNQLSMYGAVSNWCEQFGLTRGRKGTRKAFLERENTWPKVYWQVWKSQEVNIFGIFSKTSIWKQFAWKHSGLPNTVRDNSIHKGMRRRIIFVRRVSAGMSCKNQTWRGRRFWADHSIMPRIHAFSSKPTIQSLCSNSWRNKCWTSHWSSNRENSGPVMDLKLQIPSTKPIQDETSYVLISRGKSRFLDGLRIPNAELRSSAELLSETSASRRKRTSLGTAEDQHPGNWCADSLSISPRQASFFTQRTIPTIERKWKVIPHGGALPDSGLQNGYNNCASLRPRWKTTWRSAWLGHDEAGTAESVRKTGSTRFLREACWLRLIHEGSSKTRFE